MGSFAWVLDLNKNIDFMRFDSFKLFLSCYSADWKMEQTQVWLFGRELRSKKEFL